MKTMIKYSDGIYIETDEVFGTEQTIVETFSTEEDLSKYSDKEIIKKIINEEPEHLKNATIVLSAHIPVFGILDCINRCYGLKLGEVSLVEGKQWLPSSDICTSAYIETGNFHSTNFENAYNTALREYRNLESFDNTIRRAVLPMATFVDIKIAGNLLDYLQFISSVSKQDSDFIKTMSHGIKTVLWHLFQNVVEEWLQRKEDEKHE